MVDININPIIEQAFRDFVVDGRAIPIAFLKYIGKDEAYMTYYTWSERPENFADDENESEVSHGTIDLFSKTNFKKILKSIKEKLKKFNFTWTDNGPEDFEPDTGYYHVPVNFYYEGGTEE